MTEQAMKVEYDIDNTIAWATVSVEGLQTTPRVYKRKDRRGHWQPAQIGWSSSPSGGVTPSQAAQFAAAITEAARIAAEWDANPPTSEAKP